MKDQIGKETGFAHKFTFFVDNNFDIRSYRGVANKMLVNKIFRNELSPHNCYIN